MKKCLFILIATLFFSVSGTSKTIPSAEDPIIISAGKPTIVIVSVFSKDDKEADTFFSKRELTELQNNFPEYDVKLIDYNCSVVFQNNNKDIINLSNPTESIELVAFWDGKTASVVKISKIKVKLTEYVSGITSQKKQSSYLADNEKIMADFHQKKTVFNPDTNSKLLGQYYIIDMLFNKMVYGDLEYFKPQNYKNVKSVTVYAKSPNDPEEIAFKMNFNDKHLVSDILYAKRKNSNGTVFFVFNYDDNNLLKKMISNENFSNEVMSTVFNFSYNKNKIIETSEDQFSVYSIQHDLLINDYHYEFENIETDFRIKSSREEIKENCKFFYEDNLITNSYCPSSFESRLPYSYKNTLYEDDMPTKSSSSKIEKTIQNTLSILSFSSAIKEFKQIGEVTIGENGLTNEIKTFSRGQSYILRFEYK